MNDDIIVPVEEFEYDEETLLEECLLIEEEHGFAEIHRTVTEEITYYCASFDEVVDD